MSEAALEGQCGYCWELRELGGFESGDFEGGHDVGSRGLGLHSKMS